MSARSSGTTSIATISAPASSARRASSGPDSSSLSRREALVETVSTAALIEPGTLRRLAVRLLAAGLLEQGDLADLEVLLQALDHVVDRERGDARGGQRLHLDPGPRRGARLGGDDHLAP